MAAAQRLGMGFAEVKEAVADALTAIGRQQHGFGAPQDMIARDAAPAERGGEVGAELFQRG